MANISLVTPTKDHPLYSKYNRTAVTNKIVKLAVLAVVIIYLITVFFAPVFTTSIKIVNEDKDVMYEKSLSYTMSEVLAEQEKFNDEEKYFEDVEDGVKYLKDKDFSDLERIENLKKADNKINAYFNSSGYIGDIIEDMSENRPYEYIALAEKADAIEGYTTNSYGETVPRISYPKVSSYLTDIEQNKIAMLTKVFYAELEARNTDGLREFLSEAEKLAAVHVIGYTSEYAEQIEELKGKYLVADYKVTKEFCETLNEFASVNQFIPDSAMTKNLAEKIDMYKNMSEFASSSYASQTRNEYEAQYIYFEYDLATNELVYEQHSSIENINSTVAKMKWGVIAIIAIAVIAMIPTVIGLITRKHKKLRSLSIFYLALPLSAILLATFASSPAYSPEQAQAVGVTCDVMSAIPSAFLVVVLIAVAAIVTKVFVTSYASKYNKWLKENQATAQAAAEDVAAEAENDAPEADVVDDAPAEETTDEENN